MKECVSSSPVKTWYVDVKSEVNTIEGSRLGDTIYVINTGELYMWNGAAWQAQ